jgi:hypothetical protein
MHISSCTIGVALWLLLADGHAQGAQRFLSAAVFGRPGARLYVIAAGGPGSAKDAAPLLDAIGQRASDSRPGTNLVELSGTIPIASVIDALGGAAALVGEGGVDVRQYLHIPTSTLFL